MKLHYFAEIPSAIKSVLLVSKFPGFYKNSDSLELLIKRYFGKHVIHQFFLKILLKIRQTLERGLSTRNSRNTCLEGLCCMSSHNKWSTVPLDASEENVGDFVVVRCWRVSCGNRLNELLKPFAPMNQESACGCFAFSVRVF